MKCEACGGKLPPHSPLHVDAACDCQKSVKELVEKLSKTLDRFEWEEIENKRHRKSFFITTSNPERSED